MGMVWNHRVIKRTHKTADFEDITYGIHEVYYDTETQEILGWTQDSIAPQGDDPDELRKELERMLESCDMPILDEKELEAEIAKDNEEYDEEEVTVYENVESFLEGLEPVRNWCNSCNAPARGYCYLDHHNVSEGQEDEL